MNLNGDIMKSDFICMKCCLNVLRENHVYDPQTKIFSYPIPKVFEPGLKESFKILIINMIQGNLA